MGRQYQAKLEAKIEELGAKNLRVYINEEGVHPKYQEHLEETFKTAGVQFVSTREDANFVFEGHCEPVEYYGKITAYFVNEEMAFAGALRV